MPREVFADELQGSKIKVGEEIFTDLLLLQERLKSKEMEDAEKAEGPSVPIEAHGCCGILCLVWLLSAGHMWARRSLCQCTAGGHASSVGRDFY